MDADLMLVAGIILGVLSIPAALSAYTHGRGSRMSAAIVLIAVVLIAVAINETPSGYSFPDLPNVFGRVFGRLFN